MLIAEDLLLLLLDDESGKAAKTQELPVALGGALLVELAMAGAVVLEPKKSFFGSASVHGGGSAPDDPLLVEALAVTTEKQRSPQAVVQKLGKGAKDKIAARLVERGILEQRDDRVMGLFPRTTWPDRDAAYESQLRATLTRVLVEGHAPDQRTAALVSLLSAIDHAPAAVDGGGASKRDIKRRAKEIAEGDWAATAVKDSVQAAQAAAITAITTSAATTVAITGGS